LCRRAGHIYRWQGRVGRLRGDRRSGRNEHACGCRRWPYSRCRLHEFRFARSLCRLYSCGPDSACISSHDKQADQKETMHFVLRTPTKKNYIKRPNGALIDNRPSLLSRPEHHGWPAACRIQSAERM
jgi:hypothetical protein